MHLFAFNLIILFAFNPFPSILLSLFYSIRNDLTGFAIAARIAWKLMVNKAINSAEAPASANTCQPICIRKAKSSSHRFMAQ